MNRLFLYFIAIIIVSCSETQSQGSTVDTNENHKDILPISKIDTAKATVELIKDSIAGEEGETETCYVVIADTGTHYYSLRDKMLALHDTLRQAIDTMHRTYNVTKDLIALPEDDEDDLYAGDYYPRRFPSQELSLEYLNFYLEQAREKSIALVTGIYETKNSADSALDILRKVSPKAFVVKSDIYMGCIH
ncbi:hypothetical protein OCK74_05615 [Chitinophagaceae bacterium LB-8]|uniref:Uncharacterized protein n=1 Tax=Paraflavisolibacter caeni TaxID=2982496 RepID=A0A9X2XVR8_9BACT|nr:hypothetical protein [Paraflavisolibacter caeni]MCU7548583.1 hypothetical protein [Paraflavisolibacter caeni]